MLYTVMVTLERQHKAAILFALDIGFFLAAFFTAYARLDPPVIVSEQVLAGLLVAMTATVAAALYVSRLHLIQLNYYQHRAILGTFCVGSGAALLGFVLAKLMATPLPLTFFLYVCGMFVLLSVGGRLLFREFVVAIYRRTHGAFRVLIYGAGQTGQQLAAALSADKSMRVVGFVDDERSLHGAMISGLRVYPTQDLEKRIEGLEVDRIVLALPSLSDAERGVIAERLSNLACEVHTMPTIESLLIKPEIVASTKPLDFSSLLGRHALEAELPAARDMYFEKCILITGAGGSIGSEICLQIAAAQPSQLVLLDHSEIALYEIHRKVNATYPDLALSCVLGSACETGLVNHIFAKHHVDVVVHAAAYKHLPILQDNIIEGMRNNVLSTRVIATAALAHEVESFILVSTDKAVRPTSWLGYSKRISEMIVQDLATRSRKTRMSMVRFGNVLGSSGSVIPLFQEQIAKGGPVTLTHHDVTRYFMTISEAVRLVLLAGSFARGGDVFVLDMGEPVPIRVLARNLIEASGYSVRDAANPEGDIELRITGLRPGEKIEEELLIGTDMLTTMHPKILRAIEPHPSEIETANLIAEIMEAVETYDEMRLNLAIDRFGVFLGWRMEAPKRAAQSASVH